MDGRAVLGLALAVLAVVAAGAAAWRTCRRLLPGWDGPPLALAATVVATALVVAPAQLVGSLGAFRPVPLVAATLAASLALAAAVGRPEPAAPRALLPRELPPWLAVATATVGAAWAARLAEASLRGIAGVETMRYRLPLAARFVQEGSVVRRHLVETQAGSLVAYYPHTAELLFGLGMVATGDDLLAIAFGPASAALLLLAAWCLGRVHGVAPASTLGALVVLAMPDVLQLHAGDTTTDLLVVALVLTAAALLSERLRRPGSPQLLALAAAGYAAGTAAGVKYTAIASLGLLTLAAVALAEAGQRVRTGWVWTLAAVAGTGPWYVRNLVRVGNPVPPIGISLGPFELRPVEDAFDTSALLGDIFRPGTLGDHVLPGLRLAWGPGWWLTALVLAVAVVATLARPADRAARAMALVGAGSLLAFAAIPQPVETGTGDHIYFGHNVRYALPGVALALALLPTARPARRRAWAVQGALLASVLAAQLARSTWGLTWFGESYGFPVATRFRLAGAVAGAALLALLTAWPRVAPAVRARLRGPRRRAAAGALALLATFALLVAVGDAHATRRHRRVADANPLHAWGLDASGERIGLSGMRLQYPFYGRDLSNHVQYLGHARDDGAFVPITSCERWKAAVDAGRFDHVVVSVDLLGIEPPDVAGWAAAEPSLRPVVRTPEGVVYEVTGPMHPETCPAG